MIDLLPALDQAVNSSLAPLRHGLPLAAFRFLTTLGAEAAALPVAVAASGLLAAGRRGGLVAPLWLTLLGAEATTYGLKYLVGRPRPPTLAGVAAISPSFPSAHATVAVALYGFLALVIAAGLPGRRALVLMGATAVILAIGASRLVLSLHYVSDVLAGYAIGGAWLWASSRWAMLRTAPRPERLGRNRR